MIMDFDEQHRLKGTDYWSGLPQTECWMSSPTNIWQVLCPPMLWEDFDAVIALPCTSKEHPECPWYWLLIPTTGQWRLRVPHTLCRGGDLVEPPGRGACYRRFLNIFDDPKSRTPDGEAWEPTFTRPLWVIRLEVTATQVRLDKLVLKLDDIRRWKELERRAKRGRGDGPSRQWSRPEWRKKDRW